MGSNKAVEVGNPIDSNLMELSDQDHYRMRNGGVGKTCYVSVTGLDWRVEYRPDYVNSR